MMCLFIGGPANGKRLLAEPKDQAVFNYPYKTHEGEGRFYRTMKHTAAYNRKTFVDPDTGQVHVVYLYVLLDNGARSIIGHLLAGYQVKAY